MSVRQILETFELWRARRLPLVLATVADTEGSTYTKAGHRILINADGDFQGLVSGGCLEGDLAAHARDVVASGRPRLLTYDLRDDSDELFGLGIGCNGLFRVLLQPLRAETGYAPFSAMAGHLLGDTAGGTATVVESQDPALTPGATVATVADAEDAWDVAPAWRETLVRGCRQHQQGRQAVLQTEHCDGGSARVLYAPLRPLPRLLVLGAGLDAVALVSMARCLGWRITVADHRPANLARGDLGDADQVLHSLPADLGHSLPVEHFAAAVVMSHHLESDRLYLQALAGSPVPYVGLLGPAARRDRLLADLGPGAAGLRRRLHAPVGLAIGADSPESIALAILAEIHATLAGDVAAGR